MPAGKGLNWNSMVDTAHTKVEILHRGEAWFASDSKRARLREVGIIAYNKLVRDMICFKPPKELVIVDAEPGKITFRLK